MKIASEITAKFKGSSILKSLLKYHSLRVSSHIVMLNTGSPTRVTGSFDVMERVFHNEIGLIILVFKEPEKMRKLLTYVIDDLFWGRLKELVLLLKPLVKLIKATELPH